MPTATLKPVEDRPWIVQSYSGESLKLFMASIVQDSIASCIDKARVAIVCSACFDVMPESTSQLLFDAACRVKRQRRSPKAAQYVGHLDYLCATADLYEIEYSSLARKCVDDPMILEDLLVEIEEDCGWLRNFLSSHTASFPPVLSLKARDILVGIGEKLSAKLLRSALLCQGIDSKLIYIEDIEAFTNTHKPESDSWLSIFSRELHRRLDACHPSLPILTGFLWSSAVPRSADATQAGTISVLAPLALNARELQIWGTGEALRTADSRRGSASRVIETLSVSEAIELARHGHPCLDHDMLYYLTENDIVISLKCIDPPLPADKVKTTVVRPRQEYAKFDADLLTEYLVPSVKTIDRRPTALVVKDSAVMMTVSVPQLPGNSGAPAYHATRMSMLLMDVMQILHRHRAPFELMNTSADSLSIVFEKKEGGRKIDFDRLADDLADVGILMVQFGMSIITLVGDQLRSSSVGITGRVVSTLAHAGVKVSMISPAAGSSMSFVVSAKELDTAVKLIHQTVFRKVVQLKPTAPLVIKKSKRSRPPPSP
ncbi:hypothetical protein CVT24_002930 [Panaeolus cyanescens]|uniref:aspartate kinase n=1 Tax=Panaeolus cyanescens TaxID=181874 RepID=A0A409VP17_9AGAR|nr:hypothetical protein CVT24_002930 [Panaeolus cyanescens]